MIKNKLIEQLDKDTIGRGFYLIFDETDVRENVNDWRTGFVPVAIKGLDGDLILYDTIAFIKELMTDKGYYQVLLKYSMYDESFEMQEQPQMVLYLFHKELDTEIISFTYLPKDLQ